MGYAIAAAQGGVLFPPNGSGKSYISLAYHRLPRNGKSQWAVDVPVEYEVFCDADNGVWNDKQGHYWGLKNGGEMILGTRYERICKFWRPTNEIDPWHGHPVSPHLRGDSDAPEDSLVEKWIAEGVVKKTFGRRIQRRKI